MTSEFARFLMRAPFVARCRAMCGDRRRARMLVATEEDRYDMDYTRNACRLRSLYQARHFGPSLEFFWAQVMAPHFLWFADGI